MNFDQSEEIVPKVAAKILGVSHLTLAKWRCTKKRDLPYSKRFGHIYYLLKDVLDFKERSTQTDPDL